MDQDQLISALAQPFSLAGKRILISGAGGGIGVGTVRVCAGMGADLVLADIVDEAALRNRLGGLAANARFYRCNSSVRAEVDALAAAVGPVDAVIDTAGICPSDDWTAADWDTSFDRVIGVNLRGPINLSRAFMPGMVAKGGGRFAFCGSLSGQTGGIVAGPHYAASKGGLHSFIRSFSQHAAPHGILVNGVAPANTDTPMMRSMQKHGLNTDRYPLKRFAMPEEVGAVLAFLCSPAAGFISGAILDINGGTYFH